MLTGKRFELGKPTIAIDTVNGTRVAAVIPEGGVIRVISGPTTGDRMVDVLFEGRRLVMFAADAEVRGAEIKEQRAAG